MLRFALRCALASPFLLAACSDDVSEAMETDASSSEGSNDDGPGPSTITVTSAPPTTDDSSSGSSGPSTVDSTGDSSSSESTDTTGESSSSESSSEEDSSSSGSSGSSSSSDASSTSGESSSTTDTSACGDGLIDADEVCDTTDLAGASCLSLEFDGGELACQPTCDAYDTSGCFSFSCGNGMIEGTEFCDGADLAGESCMSLDFDGGELACARNCGAYDTSGCFSFTCGNGTIEGAETCDGMDLGGNDCIALDFDGGVLACAGDCTYDTSGCFSQTCGNDTLEGAEVCDGTALGSADCVSEGFDGGTLACMADCSALDTSGCVDFFCGDGAAQSPEACDGTDFAGQSCASLGFVAGTLACNGDCTIDSTGCTPTFQEVEPNDDGDVAVDIDDFSTVNANGPFTTNTFIHAAISPAGDEDVFAIHNPGPSYATMRIETFGVDGMGTCAVGLDTVIDLRTAANTLIASNDDGGVNACSLLTGVVIAPGETQYLRVIEFSDDAAISSYFIEIDIDPVVCGDAVVGVGELCDDGNVMDGDGCSSTCQFEGVDPEIEPNGTAAEADAAGLVLDGSSLVQGSIGVVGDLDVYRLELVNPEIVRFETFSGDGVCAGISTTLRLQDALGADIIVDNSSGISTCSALTFPLAAGTYYVQVEENGNNLLVPTYLLEVQTQSDQALELEPNETLATANTNLQTSGSDVYVFGDHALATDSDYYAIDVPVAGSSLRLETIEGDRAIETCESNGIDSRITLFNALGVQLADDDDEGRGWCSIVDGTGSSGLDAGAHNLAAGTYYVQVRASSSAQASAAGQFIYRLVATVRSP